VACMHEFARQPIRGHCLQKAPNLFHHAPAQGPNFGYFCVLVCGGVCGMGRIRLRACRFANDSRGRTERFAAFGHFSSVHVVSQLNDFISTELPLAVAVLHSWKLRSSNRWERPETPPPATDGPGGRANQRPGIGAHLKTCSALH
jgi:hypothetical protein